MFSITSSTNVFYQITAAVNIHLVPLLRWSLQLLAFGYGASIYIYNSLVRLDFRIVLFNRIPVFFHIWLTCDGTLVVLKDTIAVLVVIMM